MQRQVQGLGPPTRPQTLHLSLEASVAPYFITLIPTQPPLFSTQTSRAAPSFFNPKPSARFHLQWLSLPVPVFWPAARHDGACGGVLRPVSPCVRVGFCNCQALSSYSAHTARAT